MSPMYDPANSGPYTLRTYPSDFVAIDDAILDTEQPKLWLLSSMDFHGEDTTDQLGWEYGTVDPQDASNDWINLNIANMGHEELIDGPSKQLWLSDLKAYQAEDWPNEDPAEQ